jgi:hypothetical protein
MTARDDTHQSDTSARTSHDVAGTGHVIMRAER